MIYSMLYTSGSTVVKSTVFRISEQTGSGYNKDVHHPSKNYRVGLMPSARLEVGGYFCTVQSFCDVMVIMIEVVAL